MEKMPLQDKLFALGAALIRRHNYVVKGRSIENLKTMFGKIIDALVEVYDGEMNMAAFEGTPFVELTPLADQLPDPADYWKNG